ncbi:hypothetical protein ACFVAJ_17485 [Agromyces sp. NPDC057679]|uniref:hypothetical protein n=1 Tax=Agromyces sp. NPDC057679 TaxID=3346207 RepID=UPI00366AD155
MTATLKLSAILGPNREPDPARIRISAPPANAGTKLRRPTHVMLKVRPAEQPARIWHRVWVDAEGFYSILVNDRDMLLDEYLADHIRPIVEQHQG